MSNVSLEIGGRNFSVASAAGEEEHVAMLGRRIDDKLRAMGGVAGQSETRMLLFAALLLADELHDMANREGAPPPPPPPPPSPPPPPDLTPQLVQLVEGVERAADGLENLAAELERAAA